MTSETRQRFLLNHRIEGPADAPWLVLAHSLGADLGMWAPQMPSFRRQFRVLRYDSRGHGKSDVTAGPYAIPQLAEDLIALLDHVEAKCVQFCGLSMGGMIGMWLARHHPDRISRMVLCNTGTTMGTPETWNARLEQVQKQGISSIVEMVLDRWFTPEFKASAPKDVEIIRDMVLRTSDAGYVATGAALRDADLRRFLSDISTPTLVIAGAADPAAPPESSRLVASSIKNARYIELPASHFSNWEAADRFTWEVVNFLG